MLLTAAASIAGMLRGAIMQDTLRIHLKHYTVKF